MIAAANTLPRLAEEAPVDEDLEAVMAMSDEEIDAELRADGVDVEAFVARTRDVVERARLLCARVELLDVLRVRMAPMDGGAK